MAVTSKDSYTKLAFTQMESDNNIPVNRKDSDTEMDMIQKHSNTQNCRKDSDTKLASARMDSDTAESGYSWVILFAATLVSFFQLGIVKVFGVFIPELVEQLQMSSSSVGLCCGIGIGLRAVLGPLWTALTRATSNRSMVMVGGILSSMGIIFVSLSRSAVHLGCSMAIFSIGSGMPYIAKVNVIKEYFHIKFNLANSLAFAGGAVGMTVLAPLIELCIESFEWRGAMLIYGAMNFNITLAGALMRNPRKPSNSIKITKQEKSTFLQSDSGFCENALNFSKLLINYLGFPVLLRYRAINWYLLAMTIHALVNSGWILFLVSYTISIGFTLRDASILAALGGSGALVGRILISLFLHSGILTGHMTFFWLATGGTGMLFCYPFVHIYWALGLISFLTGMLLGTTSSVFVVMMKEVVEDDSADFSAAVGLHYMFRGVGMLVGGSITGWLYDATGNFYFSYITLAIMESLAAFLVILPSLLHSRCHCHRQRIIASGVMLNEQDVKV